MTDAATDVPLTLAVAAKRYNAQVAASLEMEQAPRPSPTVTTGDCATAWAMLDRCLAASPQIADALDKGGCLVVVEVPGPDWIRPVRETLKLYLSGPTEMDDAQFKTMMETLALPDDEETPFSEEPEEPVRPEWAWFSELGEKDRHWAPHDIDSMTTALGNGKGVIMLASRLDRMPASVRHAADHHLTLPTLDGAAMTVAAHVLTGHHPSITIDDRLCGYLNPDILRLSRRLGEDGDAWIQRLRSFANLASQAIPYAGPKLADLHGMDDAKKWGLNLLEDLKEYRAGRLPWQDVDRGCLLVGPTGTGKTSFARILAGTTGLPLVTGSHSEWQAAGHLGHMLAAMRSTFNRARIEAPCILFLDEVDAFPDRQSLRNNQRDYSLQVVNALLEATDGTLAREGVVLLAAANSLAVDPALVRPGRLDRVIMVSLPDDQALAGILRQHLGPDHLPGVDLLPYVAGMVASGAEAELWARDAKRKARRAGRPMTPEDLVADIPRPEAVSPDLHFRVAVHEAGHAIAAAIEMPGKVQIVKVQGDHAGVRFELGQFDTAAHARSHIRILLAGRAAEELCLGAAGFGSGGPVNSDLARATSLAASMLAGHGFGDRLLWLGNAAPENAASFLSAHPSLADQVSRMLTEEHERVMALLRPRQQAIDKVACILLERGSMSGHELEVLVAAIPTSTELAL
ncbi:AAA family ATPase [Niveispirillum fermenti]|uniref:AAA family ATPase n=1 Tax=Niveispirillum fermenti TaxID=1233113 RepID=UPI003A86E76E